MMIPLFPKCKSALLACGLFSLLFASARLYDGASPFSALLLFVFLMSLGVLGVGAYSVVLHQRLLLLLYGHQQPAEFIRIYEPLRDVKPLAANVRFTLTAYLSNAYAAQGDFDRALQLLDEAPHAGRREETNRRMLLCGNRASIALARGDGDEAAGQLSELESLLAKARLGKRKRQEQENIVATLRTQLNVLRGENLHAACDYLRAKVEKGGSPLLRTELNYFIGSAYAQRGEAKLARPFLTQSAQAGGALHYARLAEQALASLPEAPVSKK